MFCEKCGNKVNDNSKFCEKCGNKLNNLNSSNKLVENIGDDTIQLSVTPTYKWPYMLRSYIITFFIMVLLGAIPLLFVDILYSFFAIIVLFIILGFIAGIDAAFTRRQYKAYKYNFYKTKLIFKDTFLNLAEKEIKYKYIREITLSQTLFQRFFNLGHVRLYTNAESGICNGIVLVNIENPYDVYKQLKALIDV